MEQKFNNSFGFAGAARVFANGRKEFVYRKGDKLERMGAPTRWFAIVTEGCCKYVKYGMSDDKAHIAWFSLKASSCATKYGHILVKTNSY